MLICCVYFWDMFLDMFECYFEDFVVVFYVCKVCWELIGEVDYLIVLVCLSE